MMKGVIRNKRMLKGVIEWKRNEINDQGRDSDARSNQRQKENEKKDQGWNNDKRETIKDEGGIK